jgi:DNA replication and repair protein RecF
MPAERCSTGEQKALLVGIVLAHARLQAVDEGAAPILLLDEVAAHLDDRRRAALFEAVLALGGQAWLTGTDRDVFAPIADRAQILEVTDGRLAPAGIVGFRGETSNG